MVNAYSAELARAHELRLRSEDDAEQALCNGESLTTVVIAIMLWAQNEAMNGYETGEVAAVDAALALLNVAGRR